MYTCENCEVDTNKIRIIKGYCQGALTKLEVCTHCFKELKSMI
jgi:predicted esterase